MASTRPNIAADAVDAMLSDYIQQYGTSCRDDGAPQQPHAHGRNLTALGEPADDVQFDELLTLDSLFDLPEYDPLAAETLAAPPGAQPQPTPNYPSLVPPAQLPLQAPADLSSPNSTAFSSTPSGHRSAVATLPHAAAAMSTLSPEQTPAFPFRPSPPPLPAPAPQALLPHQHAPFQHPHIHQSTITTHDFHTLLNDPLTATLIAAQLNATRPRTHRPPDTHTLAAAAPAPPIAKPRRKKVRPKDTINALQQHLDGITDKMRGLSLRNRQLHKQKLVLDAFVQGLARYQDVATLVKAVEAQCNDPSVAATGVAASRNWTTEQFIDAYKKYVTWVSLWITRMEASSSSDAPSDADVAELRAATKAFRQAMLVASNGRPDFILRGMAEQLKLFPDGVCEEEHWMNVLEVVNLNEGQVEDLLAAREVFLRCSDNIRRENDLVKATLQQATELPPPVAGEAAGGTAATQVQQLATVLQKVHGLVMVHFFFWFEHTLSPMQAARTVVRAYPLMPDPIILMNTLHSLRGGDAASAPLLGPQLAPFATARTFTSLHNLRA